MRYLGLAAMEQKALLAELEAMPDHLATAFAGLSPREATVAGPDGALAPVEQTDPLLADFDGARIARERAYRSLSLAEGLAAFRRARQDNLARLRTLSAEQWRRDGSQEGVGPIALCDVPAMMAEHDAGHRGEIEAWRQARDRR